MTEKDMTINHILMEEMGLEIGDRRRIIDQDTGIQYQMKGRDIVSPGSQSGKSAIEFDPINNTRMMSFMFGNFVEKLVDEESIPPINGYYVTPADGKGKVKAEIIFEDNTKISSRPYNNETSCYADLVLRLNGEEEPDMSEYDIDRSKKPNMAPMKKFAKPKKDGKKK